MDIGEYKPSAEYRYFLYDPEGNGMTFYKTADKRNKAAERAIRIYIDGTWDDENVIRVLAGEVSDRPDPGNYRQCPVDHLGDGKFIARNPHQLGHGAKCRGETYLGPG